MIKLQRVYDYEEHPEKGYAILIDRLWPRGVKKTDLQVDEWLKDIAPSTALRKWFSHDPAKWNDFKKDYISELKSNKELLHRIKELEKEHATILFLYAAKDQEHNHAIVLKEILDKWK
ncbi:MAG TPA: DUF488 family protein [Cytophagaceae bacterium]